MFSLDKPFDSTPPSDLKQLSFVTEIGGKLCPKFEPDPELSVLRSRCIVEMSQIIPDVDIAIRIEAGIYEYSVIYCHNNNFDPDMIVAIYSDKLTNMLFDISKKPELISEHQPQTLAFKTPSEINPAEWTEFIRKRELKEYKKKNIATTDLYKCYKCNERRCQVRELQTRSADEPMTLIITCLVCGNQFTK